MFGIGEKEYSEGKIHKSEPEPRNGNVNTVYLINQARGVYGVYGNWRRHVTLKTINLERTYTLDGLITGRGVGRLYPE